MFLLPIDVFSMSVSIDGSDKIYFEPNLKKEIIVEVSEVRDVVRVPIKLKGDFVKYATVQPDVLNLQPGETKQAKISLELPGEIKEGIHIIEVTATEIPVDSGGGAFNLMPAAGISLKIINTDVKHNCNVGLFTARIGGGGASVVLNAMNDGTNKINGAYADFSVYGPEENKIASWQTQKFSIPPFDSKTIESSVNLQGIEPEDYEIKGVLYCAGKVIDLNKGVTYHATDLDIKDFRVSKENGRLKMQIDLENKYKVPIPVSGMIWFYSGDKKVEHFSTTKKQISPMSTETIGVGKYFVDVHVPPGTYDLKGTIYYEGMTEATEIISLTLTEEDFKSVQLGDSGGFSVSGAKQTSLEKPGFAMTSKTLIRLFAVLIILAVAIFIFVRKFRR